MHLGGCGAADTTEKIRQYFTTDRAYRRSNTGVIGQAQNVPQKTVDDDALKWGRF